MNFNFKRFAEDKVEIRTSLYEFVMDPSISFGSGRYEGSSLGNFTTAGWYWSLPDDRDIATWFFHLAHSRASIKELEDGLNKRPDLINMIKSDIAKSDMTGIVQAVLGWRGLEELGAIIDEDVNIMLDEGEISKERAEELKDFLYSKIDDIFSDIVKLVRSELRGLVGKGASISGILESMRSTEIAQTVLDTAYEVVNEWIYSNYKKIS